MLIDSTDQYNRSSRPADFGEPMVPLYTDFNAWGTYGAIDDAYQVTLDANAPDARQGTSSVRAAWNGSAPNGYFQFGLGASHANRPRAIPEFGEVQAARFMAKGDTAGQQIRVNVFRTQPGGWQSVATQVVTFSTQWQDFAVALPAGIAPSDLHSVQFVIGDGLPSGEGTFHVDYVRLSTNGVPGFDPARLLQSYQARWASADSTDGAAWRDLNIYPNRSSLYDNALAIKALLADGGAKARQAALDLADTLVATARSDGSHFNNRAAGHVFLGDGSQRAPADQRRTLGDNAWCGLALLDAYRATGNSQYLHAAKAISDWAEANLKSGGAYGGYRGGYGADGALLPWRSTEHNIDLFALNKNLAFVLGEVGDAGANVYVARAAHAAGFVLAMYDSTGLKFWTGTDGGDTIQTGSIPLDAQLWAVQAMSIYSQYRDAADWQGVLAWAEENLWQTDGPYAGFTYSTAATPGRVWLEGVGQGAATYDILGQAAGYAQAITTLEFARTSHENGDGLGIVAATGDGLEDPLLDAVYDARLHAGATAWTGLAMVRREVFAPFDIAAFLGSTAFFQQNELQLAGGELWYSLETTRHGLLTLEAVPAGSTGQVELALYDGNLGKLSTSTPLDGKPRIDWPADPGQIFFVRLSGSAEHANLRILNLLSQESGATAIQGTPGSDQFTVDLAARRITVHEVGYDLPESGAILIDGAGGYDGLRVVGSGGTDTAKLWPHRATVMGGGYSVAAVNVESSSFDGGAGRDRAFLYGSRGANALFAGEAEAAGDPRYITLTDEGVSLAATAEVLYADGRGGKDTAVLYESAVSDLFQPFWNWTRMRSQDDGYQRDVSGFREVARIPRAALLQSGDSQAELPIAAEYSDAAHASVANTAGQSPADLAALAQILWWSDLESDSRDSRPIPWVEINAIDQFYAPWE